MGYNLIKWLHILSATILFGTGIGSAFFMFIANRRRNLAEMHAALRHVVLADWVFTSPSVVFQLLSGLYLVRESGYHLTDGWIVAALALYVFAGLCWLPVVWLQLKMRDQVAAALKNNAPLPPRYWQYDRWWIILGALAFPAVMLIFWLMVAKPYTNGLSEVNL